VVKVLFLLIIFFSSIFAQFGNANISIEDDSTLISKEKPKISQRKEKNILDAFISLVVPGWSFFKKKEYVKGAAFVATDVATITGFVYYSKKGASELQRSKDYADKYYNVENFEEFNDTVMHSNSFMLNPNIIPYSDTVGHIFEYDKDGNVIKDLNYYEMIGKYEKFVQGWSDVSPNYNSIIDSYGNVYIPKMKGDSVEIYDSKYPNSLNNKYILIDNKSTHFVLQDEMIEFNKAMMVPIEHFYFGRSQRALDYMEIRDLSNKYNTYADMMIWVLAINHLTSFGFSIYHIISDDNFSEENNEDKMVSSFTINPIINFNTQTKGLDIVWNF